MQRRKLRFESIDDALGEAERLAKAEREGRLKQIGNWTLGQILGHLAAWANFAQEGYPKEVRAPLPVRMILKLFRGTILNRGMMAGVRVGRIPAGTVAIDVIPTEEGLTRFRTALQRLRDNPPIIANPVFGKLTHEQWIALNLRHAELHFSFLDPG
jgi:hypothetical protein